MPVLSVPSGYCASKEIHVCCTALKLTNATGFHSTNCFLQVLCECIKVASGIFERATKPGQNKYFNDIHTHSVHILSWLL